VDQEKAVIVLSNVSGINQTIDELSFELLRVTKNNSLANPN
jgi:hypothetical protein